jgi:hypothetical protein
VAVAGMQILALLVESRIGSTPTPAFGLSVWVTDNGYSVFR